MNIPAVLYDFLAAQTTLTLATANADGSPQTCDVFYVHDDALAFYFLSDPKTRHVENLTRDPRVSATIHAMPRGWKEIRGVQIVGEARRAEDAAERARALGLYLAKFVFVRAWLPNVSALGQWHKQLGLVELYRISPNWLRWIDNTEKFGYKAEWVRIEQEWKRFS